MKYLSKQSFYNKEFYAFCQRTYDEARHYLKTCGRPADDYDKMLIAIAKETANIYGALL